MLSIDVRYCRDKKLFIVVFHINLWPSKWLIFPHSASSFLLKYLHSPGCPSFTIWRFPDLMGRCLFQQPIHLNPRYITKQNINWSKHWCYCRLPFSCEEVHLHYSFHSQPIRHLLSFASGKTGDSWWHSPLIFSVAIRLFPCHLDAHIVSLQMVHDGTCWWVYCIVMGVLQAAWISGSQKYLAIAISYRLENYLLLWFLWSCASAGASWEKGWGPSFSKWEHTCLQGFPFFPLACSLWTVC